jgi:hypothetical protein
MLIPVPFTVATETTSKYSGQVSVDPAHISGVNRTFDRVVVLMKNGRVFSSEAPKKDEPQVVVAKSLLPGAVAESMSGLGGLVGLPDDDLLNEWYETFVAAINAALSVETGD